jgi:uncharacterized protein (UPF0218 family)
MHLRSDKLVTMRRLTPELRKKLKGPMGVLIRGSFNETMRKLEDMVKEEHPSKIVAVGDRVSKNLVENGVFPQLSIVDNKVMRRKIRPVTLVADETFYVRNPPGTITNEASAEIRRSLRQKRRVKIVVDGEEDLLVLVAVLYAPKNSFVVYGQPREGIVVVKVTEEKREEAAEILNAMETVSKS